ncbi:MAG: PhzF family phenazine biosynthesis protein [Chloroflexi bacterium]|nr:PhzF family phenazine biosynthesis protein [Chloroflexota bacterium]
MPRSYRFVQVDVFTDVAFGGNQLAVFPDAAGLSDDEMLTLTRELNYSESTFVLAGSSPATPRLKIFTPGGEIPFAGHPTIGTAFVLAQQGRWADLDEAVFEETIGPVRVRFQRDADNLIIWMQHGAPQWGPIFEQRAILAQALGLDESDLADLPAQVVSTGVPFLFVPVRNLEAARRIQFDPKPLLPLFGDQPISVFTLTTETERATSTVHSRMFAPHTFAIAEDPATGGASGPLGAYLVRYGLVPVTAKTRIVSEQGLEMGRPSFITIEVTTEGDAITDIWIGGQAVPVAEGTFWVPEAHQSGAARSQ